MPLPAPPAELPPPPPPTACLADGSAYLRARVRGEYELDVAWRGDELSCEGGPRPDGGGLRVTLAGPQQKDGRRLRFVFGLAGVREGRDGEALPTNLTLIFEGEQRLFATRGDGRCTTDRLRQQRIGELGGPVRSWKIEASGFCTGPAQTLDGSARVVVTRFDYAARIRMEYLADDPPPSPAAR
jgi:hypothetical protein